MEVESKSSRNGVDNRDGAPKESYLYSLYFYRSCYVMFNSGNGEGAPVPIFKILLM